MQLSPLPENISSLLDELDAPHNLRRHLTIVHSTASDLLLKIKNNIPECNFNGRLILFGAGTHDIGKIQFRSELREKGNLHETAGYKILLEHGFSEKQSRFAKTHGNWRAENLTIEDLLVTLSDKIWKGKRIIELEEQICQMISKQAKIDYWTIYLKFNSILENLALDADKKIIWQGN